MQRLTFSQLILSLIQLREARTLPQAKPVQKATVWSAGTHLILCDSEIVCRLLKEAAVLLFQAPAEVVEGVKNPKALNEAIDQLGTEPLFGSLAPVLVKLGQKVTKTQWKDVQPALLRLEQARQEKSDVPPLWLTGSAALRKFFADPEMLAFGKHCSATLAYAPQRNELLPTVLALLNRHPWSQTCSETTKQQIAMKAFTLYETDFELIDDHFRRMEETGLAFDEVFVDTPVMGTYQLIEAIASENIAQVQLRLLQCKQNGEEPGRILTTLHSFLRQFIRYAALLQSGKNETQIFQTMSVPFPAQAKFTAASKRIQPHRALQFLARSGSLEISLRQSSRSFDLLAVEFTSLLS